MKKILFCISWCALVLAAPARLVQAAAIQQKTITGTVTTSYASGLRFTTSSGANYTVDSANAVLMRKNGSPMSLEEYMAGDKIEVKGTVWYDNSISASSIRDLTLYAHTGTFSGKIVAINPTESTFILQSSQPASRTIHTNSLTTYKKNGSGATFAAMEIGMSATVQGMWERQNTDITATKVLATLRLINIDVTGKIMMKGTESLTVLSSNTIYGIDISQASFKNKAGKIIPLNTIKTGDTVYVSGKHISGSVQITASTVKDTTAP